MAKLLAGASILCIAMVLLGVNRGFDISDEGLYILLADPRQENVAGIFNYDLFFKSIFHFTGYSFSLTELRVFRLFCYLGGAWALACFWKNIFEETKIRSLIFWISALGLFAGYAFLPPTLSYNSLSVVLICFWLKYVSTTQKTFRTFLALGILLGLLIYIKISLALLLFPLTFLILFFREKFKPAYFIYLLLPLILLELVFWVLFDQNAWTRLSDGIPLNTERSGYQVGLMLKSIAVGGFWVIIPASLAFALGYFRRIKSPIFKSAIPFVVLGILSISYVTHITDEWNHLVMIWSAGIFGFYLGLLGNHSGFPKIWLGMLIFLPFVMHFGSNVYWLRIGIHYWVFWILAFLLCFESLKRETVGVASVLTVLLVFNGIWWHPFGQEDPLWTEKSPWTRLEKEVLLLDPELITISEKVKDFGSNERAKTLLSAYRIPGLVWLAGYQIPFSPGIWDKSQLNSFFVIKPEKMIYNQLDGLPQNWSFSKRQDLGVFQGDSLQLLRD